MAPRSIKCVLIGYFGRDAYRLFDKSTGKTYRSRDVIFEEGVGHRTLDAPVSNEGEIDDHIILQPTDKQPVPNNGLVPAVLPINPTGIHIQKLATQPITQTIRRSTHTKQPTEALLKSEASEREVEEAAELGKEWATDDPAGVQSAYVQSMATTAVMSLPDPENFSLPNSYAEAMVRPYIWSGPIEKELKVMRDREVWEEIDPPPDVRTIGTRWTFANNYDSDGNLTGRKVRLIAKGFTQIPGVDFFETYASVVCYESLWMNLAIAAANDMETWQVDYVAAYLNSKPQAEIYIELPEGAKVQGKIGRLNRTLYGTMDGAYNWWETLDTEMSELGYYCSKADPSVRSRHANGNITITSTYTDDTTVRGLPSFPTPDFNTLYTPPHHR